MDQIAHMMSEIVRLTIENAELIKNYLVRQNLMKGEPPHAHSRSVMSHTMFSDNKGFEQFAGPDKGMGTRAERAGFMSVEEGEDVREDNFRCAKINAPPVHECGRRGRRA